jgi:hypothetical protein
MEYINGLLNKKRKDLTIREAALVVRYNELLKKVADNKMDESQIEETLQNELEQAKKFRKNSLSNVTTEPGAAAEFVPESVTVGELINISDQKAEYSFLQAFEGTHRELESERTNVPIKGRAKKGIVKGEQTKTDEFKKAKETLAALNSDKISLDAQQLYNNGQISNQLATFSVIEIEALLLGDVKEGITLEIADAIINADNTLGNGTTASGNINFKELKKAEIEALPGYATDNRIVFKKGLRAIGLSGAEGKTKLNIGTLTGVDDIIDLQALVSSSSSPLKKIIIMDSQTYFRLMKLEDFKNASKNGQASTIYTGAITNIAGSDLFVTNLIPLTDADGKVSTTAANNVCGTIIVCDPIVIQHGTHGELKTNFEEDFAVSSIAEAYLYWAMNDINGKDSQNFVAVGYGCI